MDSVNRSKKSIFRFLRWRDLIVVIAGLALGWWINHDYSWTGPNDYQKWRARPQLSAPAKTGGDEKPGQSGVPPCLFIVPESVTDQRVVSGSIGDCLQLIPDGSKLDLFEIPLEGGFLHIKTDLYVPDVMPLAFTRCVVPLDDWAEQNEIYLPHVYDLFMFGSRRPYTYVNWVLPDRQQIHFQRVSSGTSYVDAVFQATSEDRTFSKSRVAWNGWGWDLNLASGLTLLSPEAYNATRRQQGSVVGIFDEQGREVRLTRRSNGDLMKIVSPSGAWIQFAYSESLLTDAKDSLRNSSKYTYDGDGRLMSVDYSTGSALKYSYDSAGRITEIEASPAGISAKNKYDSKGNIERTEAGGEMYSIRRLMDEVDIAGPTGATRVHFAQQNGKAMYTVEKIGR